MFGLLPERAFLWPIMRRKRLDFYQIFIIMSILARIWRKIDIICHIWNDEGLIFDTNHLKTGTFT
jgi:hypothetical protein